MSGGLPGPLFSPVSPSFAFGPRLISRQRSCPYICPCACEVGKRRRRMWLYPSARHILLRCLGRAKEDNPLSEDVRDSEPQRPSESNHPAPGRGRYWVSRVLLG